MGELKTDPNIADVDGVYQKLIDAHAGLSDEESAVLNARLILILINHVGDEDVVIGAIRLAQGVGRFDGDGLSAMKNCNESSALE